MIPRFKSRFMIELPHCYKEVDRTNFGDMSEDEVKDFKKSFFGNLMGSLKWKYSTKSPSSITGYLIKILSGGLFRFYGLNLRYWWQFSWRLLWLFVLRVFHLLCTRALPSSTMPWISAHSFRLSSCSSVDFLSGLILSQNRYGIVAPASFSNNKKKRPSLALRIHPWKTSSWWSRFFIDYFEAGHP